jgi:hypothetical protein
MCALQPTSMYDPVGALLGVYVYMYIAYQGVARVSTSLNYTLQHIPCYNSTNLV